ncbi:energy transducer TonB [Pseudomonas sp. B392_1p]|uniref:energy transducer TonB n=1 Tax=Pseudomonas sp. B392_1p TaxID=3457507 RepID=UPI003FD22911
MISESGRRAYLNAMQIDTWLPRVDLPHAAPSNSAVLAVLPVAKAEVRAAPVPSSGRDKQVAAPVQGAKLPTNNGPQSVQQLRESIRPPVASAGVEAAASPQTPVAPAPVAVAPPRFSLQLLRAGNCLLLVELPTGEAFQSRDPAYLLLRDLLRAAGLPDSPRLVGEPVRWPLLMRGQLEQGPDEARDFVQSFIAARMAEDEQPCACLWLIGAPALRFAGEVDEHAFHRELQIEGLGAAWTMPGLELLMDEPVRKRELWHSMRRVMRRWHVVH